MPEYEWTPSMTKKIPPHQSFRLLLSWIVLQLCACLHGVDESQCLWFCWTQFQELRHTSFEPCWVVIAVINAIAVTYPPYGRVKHKIGFFSSTWHTHTHTKTYLCHLKCPTWPLVQQHITSSFSFCLYKL